MLFSTLQAHMFSTIAVKRGARLFPLKEMAMDEYVYIDVDGFPMKAEADTMKLISVLYPGDDGTVAEREPTDNDRTMFTRDIFWSGSIIGRRTAERLACDRNLIY